jgi:hypothetical protein
MKNFRLSLGFVFFSTFLSAQINYPIGDLIFEDTLELTPLSQWIVIDDPDSNIWCVGNPQKTLFSSAHSGADALITDTSGFYGKNINDYFTIRIPWTDYWWGCGILSFYHKFDTGPGDAGIVELSVDNGTSWYQVSHQDDPNFIETNYIGIGGMIGGPSSDWIYAEMYWLRLVLLKSSEHYYPDDLLIRFTFVSDDAESGSEGWMIDDIVFRGYSPSGSVPELSYNKIKAYPNPTSGIVSFDLSEFPGHTFILYLYNDIGNLVRTFPVKNNQVNIGEMTPGFYPYLLFDDKELASIGKIIKK